LLEVKTDLKPAVGADGARDSRAFLKSLSPDVTLVDFWHSAQHVKAAADAGYTIGSGSVESANRVLVTARIERSGQSWGRGGGQGVLTFRSLLRSGRLHRAWAALAPRLSRSKGWRPPECANENNRSVARIALAA